MTKQCTILRVNPGKNSPQLGILKIEDVPFCLTLELPYLDNQKNISSIPPGKYTCLKTTNRITDGGLRIGTTFEVVNVPNRSGILFHVGNSARDTSGCILLGSGFINSTYITESRLAFNRFIETLEDVDVFNLEIRNLE